MASWATQQLVEFLATISGCADERSAMRSAVERAAEALDAEVAALVMGERIVASTGFAAGQTPESELLAITRGEETILAVPGVGECEAVAIALSEPRRGALLVARRRHEPLGSEDISVLRGMARVLALTLGQLRLIESERGLRERSEREASDRRAAQRELARLALHDALTGLPNRTLLLDRLGRALARARSEGKLVAVLFVDLDNFKLINDTLGHHVGDDLLREVALRLCNSVRIDGSAGRVANDTVARFGGDEFVVVGETLSSPEEAHGIAARIAARLAEPCEIGGERLVVTASTGVAISDGQSTPESLIRDADAAMYHAKARGRARAEVFDDAMRGRLLERLRREKELRQAVERDEFVLFYQPIYGAGGSLAGAEALIRWQHPTRGLLAPGEFIPLAEETGLICQIDGWVLREACRQLAAWQCARAIPHRFSVSVNLSAGQVADAEGFQLVRQALEESGVRPASLALEITETVLIENTESPLAVLESLRALGVGVILDDFGTGYSSLSYLQRFPLDALKLDRSFVAEIATPGRGRDIVAALLQLAQVLDLDVVAEGVETAEQLNCLQQMRCKFLQGFHLARPMPAGELLQLLRASRSPASGTSGARTARRRRSTIASSGRG